MIKNDPYKVLEKSGIAKSLLSEHVISALSEYDETLTELKAFPKEKGLKSMAEEIGEVTIEILSEDLKRIQKELKDNGEDEKGKKEKKSQSKKITEKTRKSIDYLADCRIKLKEDRKQKIASGEIKAPVKKRPLTKLKDSLKRTVSLVLKIIKDDQSKIAQVEKAKMEFLAKLSKIMGMNKLKPILEEIQEIFDMAIDKAEKKVTKTKKSASSKKKKVYNKGPLKETIIELKKAGIKVLDSTEKTDTDAEIKLENNLSIYILDNSPKEATYEIIQESRGVSHKHYVPTLEMLINAIKENSKLYKK